MQRAFEVGRVFGVAPIEVCMHGLERRKFWLFKTTPALKDDVLWLKDAVSQDNGEEADGSNVTG